jgi:nicotinate-nucleotide adenylyltransferase
LRLGIFGGTFDPIHLGHCRAAEEMGQELNLDKVFLIPAASPPHKSREPVSPFQDRLEMARLAVGRRGLLEVLDIEGNRAGFSYSIQTLKEIDNLFGGRAELFFILGVDAFLEIETWRDYRNLFQYAHFVVISRGDLGRKDLEPVLRHLEPLTPVNDDPDTLKLNTGKTLFLRAATLMDISSTQIRRLVSSGKSIRFLVPELVMSYIEEKGLYRAYDFSG